MTAARAPIRWLARACKLRTEPFAEARMLRVGIALLLALAARDAGAQDPATTPEMPASAERCQLALTSKPSTIPLTVLVVRIRTQQGATAVADRLDLNIAVGMDGAPTTVGIYRSSGNREVDRAAIAWARGARFSTGPFCPERSGVLPMQL